LLGEIVVAFRQFALLQREEELLAISEQWEALAAASRGAYFLTFGSCWASWTTIHKPQGHELRCATLHEDGKLIAVLPMVVYRRGLWRIAQTLGPQTAESTDVLLARDAPHSAASDMLDRFIAAARADIIDLSFVVEGSALAHAVERSRTPRMIFQIDALPYAVLHDETEWDTFEKSLSRSYQQQTGRKLRRLQERGAVTFDIVEGEANASIDWLLDQKAEWGERVGKLGPWLFSPQYRTYLKNLSASGDRILTFVLKLDDIPCAVKVIAVGPTLCTLIIGAYDERYNYYSPGSILDAFWVKHIFDTFRDPVGRHLDIDFGVGSERYKLHWSRGHAIETKTYKIFASHWGGVPYRLKSALRNLRTRPAPQAGTATP
jgi:CelD/BcsL family acetyltransferase involved in cellulose biosynthesis